MGRIKAIYFEVKMKYKPESWKPWHKPVLIFSFFVIMLSLFSKKSVFKQNKTQTTLSIKLSALKLCATKKLQHAYSCATDYLAK